MKQVVLFLICSLLASPSFAKSFLDSVDDILEHLKNGETKELATYFATTVNLTLLNDEGVYSKVQSENILKEFFNRNQPKEIFQIQKFDNNPNYRFIVLTLKTDNRNFKVSVKLVANDASFKITELSIE